MGKPVPIASKSFIGYSDPHLQQRTWLIYLLKLHGTVFFLGKWTIATTSKWTGNSKVTTICFPIIFFL
jgi:hypothetical protein